MHPEIAERLIALNHEFYQTFAGAFAATRRRLQPGVHKLLTDVSPDWRIVDLGCGSGEVACALQRGGFSGFYLGADFSVRLLEHAGGEILPGYKFTRFDLTEPDWNPVTADGPYDLALLFAVLHHIPSDRLRADVLQRIRKLLPAGARLFHSEWQFLNSSRLRDRIQPWDAVGLSQEQVDPGDYLIDWRSGGSGLRYVHHFNLSELADLADRSRFEVVDTFYSDGEGGKLGLYQVWQSI